MTNKEKMENISCKIDDIIKTRNNEISTLEEKISVETESIAAAGAAMQTATASGDLAAYQKAKGERGNAQDAKEMHTARVDFLKNKPYVSEAEYKKTVAEIMAIAAAADSETKKIICELSNQMAAAAAELEEIGKAADKALHNWQHEVYRDADRAKHPKAGIPYLNDEKRCNVDETVRWGYRAVQDARYQAYTRNKG